MNNIESNKFILKTNVEFLIENFIQKLKQKLPNHTIKTCDDTETFIDALTAIDLFSNNNKIIILKDLDPDSLDSIATVVTQPTEDVIIIIQRQTIPRTKAFTIIKGVCKLIELKELDEAQCAVWVRQWLEGLHLVFSEDIPSYIVSRLGTNITKLNSEVKKIAAYFANSDEKVLTQLNCNSFFSENPEAKYYYIVECFFRKRVKEVFHEISKIDEYSFTKLLHLLIGQAEKLYKIAVYKEQGMSVDDIGNILSVPKFIVTTKLLPYLSFFNKTKLIMLLDTFNKLDSELRLTKLPKNLVIESYILKAIKT